MNQQVTTLFLLDNVDSFTYNLVDELRTLDLDIKVYRNTVSADMLFERMQEQATKGPVYLCYLLGRVHQVKRGACQHSLRKYTAYSPSLVSALATKLL